MKAAVVSVIFYITVSSAQSSPECTNAISNITTACERAYLSLVWGNASDDQTTMVCDIAGACNGMLETAINACNDTQDNMMTTSMTIPTRSDLDLLCTIGPNGANCYSINNYVMNNSTINATFVMAESDCQGACTPSCRENIVELNDTLGCCLAEIVKVQMRNGPTVTNLNPESCGLPPFQFCNGSIFNTTTMSTTCITATDNLFDPNDTCSRAVEEFLNNNNSEIVNFLIDNCPTRLFEYVHDCNVNGELTQLADTLLNFSQATNSDGRSCIDFLSAFYSTEGDDRGDDEANCVTDYLMGQCSDACIQTLMNATTMYGCCFNTILSNLIGRSNDVNRQIEYAIITRDIYELCEVPKVGFCNGMIPPQYSDEANRCTMAANLFYEDDTCLNSYRALGQRSSVTEVNDAAITICTNQRCRNRMSSYTDFLIACRVGNNEDGANDGRNNSGVEEEDTGYLDLAYLTGNTTCRVNSNNASCYSSIYFDHEYGLLTEAISNPNAVCASLMGQSPQCTSDCMEFLEDIRNSTGCCLGEYSRVLLFDDPLTDLVTSKCNVSLNIRCTEIAPAQGGNGGTDSGGANTQKGLGVLTILVLVMTSTQLFQ